MLNRLRHLAGVINVVETDEHITLKGMSAADFHEDMMEHWRSKKISESMFVKIRGYEITFHRFFAIEFVFILNELLQVTKRKTARSKLLRARELMYEETWLRRINESHNDIVDLSRLKNLTWNILPTQLEFLKVFNETVPRYDLKGYMLGAKPGTGKAQPLSEPIKVPGGWTTMGELQVGAAVTAIDGTETVVTGVFPQGERDVYRLTTVDGRSTRACLEHLWDVYVGQDPRTQTVSTERLIKLLSLGFKVALPLYIPSDVETEAGFDVAGYAQSLINQLDEPHPKLEPVIDRLSLDQLERLIDDVFMGGTYLTLESEALTKHLVEIVRHCGAHVLTHELGGMYAISLESSLFTEDDRIEILMIEADGHEPVQCISVAHPSHCYVTRDYLVTHNTFNSIALMECLAMDTVIVVSPKNAISSVWDKTVSEVFKKPKSIWVSDRGGDLKPGCNYYIVHYEHLGYLKSFLDKFGGTLGKVGIILDESHNLNQGAKLSQRTDLFVNAALRPYVQYVLWQSGTPMVAIGKEATPFLKTITKDFNPSVENAFNEIFGRNARRAIDILANRIGLTTFVVEKVSKNAIEYEEYQVSLKNGKDYTLETIGKRMREYITLQLAYYKKNLPAYTKEYFELVEQARLKSPASDQQFDAYLALTRLLHTSYNPEVHKTEPQEANEFENRWIVPFLPRDLKERFKHIRSIYKYYDLKVQGEALGRILGRARTQCFTDIASNMERLYKKDAKTTTVSDLDLLRDSESKCVVFSSYVEVVDRYAEHLSANGISNAIVHGGTNSNLSAILKDFASEAGVNTIVATYQSLSTAVPLIEASTMLMLNQPFRDNERIQAIARCDRLGQKHTVRVLDIYLDTGNEPNISTRSKDIMEWSREQVAAIMGRTTVVEAVESLATLLPDEPGIETLLEQLELVEGGLESMATPTDHTHSVGKTALGW